MDTATRPARYISLKWQALLFTSLVLVAVTIGFAGLDYFELRRQFDDHRAAVNSQQVRQVQGLIEQSSKHLQQLGAALASLPEIRMPLLNHDGHQPGSQQKIREEFEHLISTLELDLGITTAAVFSQKSDLLISQGLPKDPATAHIIKMAAQRALEEESPQNIAHCASTCYLYAVVPVLGLNRSIGAILLGTPPADVVLDFKGISGTDIGLLILVPPSEGSTDPQRLIPEWKARVIALSNSNRNLELLQSFARSHSKIDQLAAPNQTRRDDWHYEVRLVPLEGFGANAQAYMVLIADITDDIERIRSATTRSIGLGIGGLLLSEALLLATLWAPMSRLRRAADILPRLANMAFEEVRQVIVDTQRRGLTRDEVDVLDDTAISLSYRLEALHGEVTRHTRDLSDRMEELAQERDFITHILDTAQAIIVTQNSDNEILMLNRYGELLTGHREDALHGQPFVSLLADHTLAPGLVARLHELAAGKREHLEEEWDVRCKDGSVLNIVWLHSRLNQKYREAPAILSIGMDITARKRAELRLAWLADHDLMTGLYNRRRFTEELKEAIASAKRYGHTGALLFFDLDQFKYINDTSGHRAGDLLLERLGESLPRLLREVDIIARLGGDEFAAVLPRARPEDAIQVARKILTHINETEFRAGGRVHKVSASIGIAMFPQDGNNVRDLLANADLAMYHVKETGRGGWHLFSENAQSRLVIQERVLWKERVEKALAENRFVLYVQPIVDIRSNTTSHYEVLLRMKSEDGSIVPPAQFIQVAERSGLIHAIDRMVLSKSIHYLAELNGRGFNVTFSINLSAHAFNDPELLPHLRRLLHETRLPPGQVVLEMTETAAVGDLASAKRLLESIKTLGCRFALDDFGTGFSSFFYMRELPMEFVKIDGSFIRHLAERPDDQALVKAMSQIARDFGKITVAEQVENTETLNLLASYQIDFAQGYLLGKPAPATQYFGDVEVSAQG